VGRTSTEVGERFPPEVGQMIMDGSFAHKIFVAALDRYKMQSPTGLSLDHINKRLYITDPHMNHVLSMDYSGQNRSVHREYYAQFRAKQVSLLTILIKAIKYLVNHTKSYFKCKKALKISFCTPCKTTSQRYAFCMRKITEKDGLLLNNNIQLFQTILNSM
jgi:hypothetical protein